MEETLKQLANPKTFSGRQGGIAQRLAGKMFQKSGDDRSPQLEALPGGLLAHNDGGNAHITVWGLVADSVLLQESAPGTAQISLSLMLDAGEEADFCIGLLVAESATASAADAPNSVGWQSAYADAQDYARFLDDCFESDDPLLKSLFAAGLNCAVAMYKELPSGFRGLWAGPGYAYPPRIYFRDGYWTAQALLPYFPEMVREHLLALAQGVHDDGKCPSGVIDSGLFSPEHLRIPGIRDWLPDHHDSPAFFVLLLADYLRWSQDWAVLDAPVGDVTVWQKAQACLAHLAAQDKTGDGLPEKAHEPNDWADNVVRDNIVRRSGEQGILFREHPVARRDPHRNVFEGNLIEDSGAKGECVAVEMLGTAEDVVLRGNRIVDTRRRHKSRTRIGIRIGKKIKRVTLDGNEFEKMEREIVDLRKR